MNVRSSALVLPVSLAGMVATAALGAAGGSPSWPVFRGDPQLTGVAHGELARELVPIWTFEAEDGFESTAAVHDGSVYVGGLDGVLYSLELESGKVRWKYEATDAIRSSPSIRNGVVYFGDETGVLHAVEAKSGVGKWTFETDAAVVSSANFADGLVVFGSQDNFLYALRPEDGSLAWKIETGSYIYGTPAAFDDEGTTSIISAGCDGYLRVVRVADGTESRRIELGAYVGASPAIQGSRAYVGTFENEFLGIDLAGGQVLWAYDPPERDFPFYSSAAVSDDLVVVGGRDKMVHALRPGTGEVAWTYDAGARVDASPVMVDDRIFVATTKGDVVALDRESGKPTWSFETGSSILASPSVASGRLVIGTLDGMLLCFGPKEGPKK
jgi:eukaryotic-like serine/threonine-protein kinase